jgi:hypothetical protein
MPLILGANSVSGGYEVDNSLRFNSGSSDYLSRTPAGAGNQTTMTISFWAKRSTLSSATDVISQGTGSACHIAFDGSNQIEMNLRNSVDGASNVFLITSQLFRDVSAWYHIVLALDTTQATNTNRAKLYVNGTQVTAFSTTTYPSQNGNLFFNEASAINIGRSVSTGSHYNGYLSEFYFIDGQALDPTDFGETDEDTNIWKPIPYTGSFGTNGFYLEFQDSSALGDDTSGNGNDFTVNNLTSIDQTTDTPTNNFCTLNPLASGVAIGGVGGNFTEGNTIFTGGSANWCASKGTFSVTQGKWYFEAKKITNANGTTNGSNAVGIGYAELQNNLGNYNPQNDSNVYGNILMLNDNGWTTNFANGTQWSSAYNVADGDIAGVALDLDSNTYTFYINGVSKNSGSLGGGYDGLGLTPCIVQYGGDTRNFYFNFGNPPYSANSYTDGAGYGNFSYSVPSGYYALNTKNLATFG